MIIYFPSLLHATTPSQLPFFTYRRLCVLYEYLSDKLCFLYSHDYVSSLQDGQSSLMIASQNGHNGVVRMLLSAGAKVDLQDEVSILRPYGNLCPDVMLYCGLEGYVHIIVFNSV